MAITFADLSAILGQLWWPFFRVGAVFLSMPFFGDALIPIWVRSLLALSIVVITAPLMPTMTTVELFSLTSLFLAFEQAIWGLMFGLILHMLFNVFTMLGQTVHNFNNPFTNLSKLNLTKTPSGSCWTT